MGWEIDLEIIAPRSAPALPNLFTRFVILVGQTLFGFCWDALKNFEVERSNFDIEYEEDLYFISFETPTNKISVYFVLRIHIVWQFRLNLDLRADDWAETENLLAESADMNKWAERGKYATWNLSREGQVWHSIAKAKITPSCGARGDKQTFGI